MVSFKQKTQQFNARLEVLTAVLLDKQFLKTA
jgi:hypothetical protein